MGQLISGIPNAKPFRIKVNRPHPIPKDEQWFWRAAWQKAERAANDDLAAGRCELFGEIHVWGRAGGKWKLIATRRFVEEYGRLPEAERARTKRAFMDLVLGLRRQETYPKKIAGAHDIRSLQVGGRRHMTFQVIESLVFLRRVGRYNLLRRQPQHK